MYIVMGATGHVGGAVARTLSQAGREVTVITRDASKSSFEHVAEVDLHDVAALRAAFKRARRAFLLNPPADVRGDTDKEELATVRAILEALQGSELEYVVASSTYGAQPGERIGDASVLYAFEQGLKSQAIPNVIVRAAYYFSNLDALLEPARGGALPTMFPADHVLPMVAPQDIGHLDALLLMEPAPSRLVHVEGPSRYTFQDVAHAFSKALDREVKLQVTPREQWLSTFGALGFSPQAAQAYANMTAAALDAPELPDEPIRGSTTLQAYIDALVQNC